MMLRSLAEAIPEEGSLTFFGDMAQQIYGNKMSWRNAGLTTPSVWRLEENYRNTSQIAQLALATAQMPQFNQDPDLVSPKSPVADGPLPASISFPSEEDELRFVVDNAIRRSRTESVAILVRDRNEDNIFYQALPGCAVRLHRDMKHWPVGPGIFCGTYHSAKAWNSIRFLCLGWPRRIYHTLPTFSLSASVTPPQTISI